MTQTHKDYETLESEHLAEIERLSTIIRNLHTVARSFEWGSCYKDTAEGYVYAVTKREVMR